MHSSGNKSYIVSYCILILPFYFQYSYEKVTSMTQGVESCKSEFDRERKQKTLAYNEEQIHKFEK